MSRPFSIRVPQEPRYGDSIVLKGKIKDDAEKFSFNLCVDPCPCPEEVAFHMKTTFPDNKVIHNYKTQTWNDETIYDNTWCKGPGSTFVIQMLLTKETVIIYDHQSYQYQFNHQYDITEIQSVQVWDDVEYISECTFKFNHSH